MTKANEEYILLGLGTDAFYDLFTNGSYGITLKEPLIEQARSHGYA